MKRPARLTHKELHQARKNSFLRGLVQFLVMVPVLFILLGGLGFWRSKAEAATGVNRTINFQGKLVNKSDGTNVADNTYTFLFKIYDSSAGGTELWGGTGESQSLTVTNGIFQAALGSVRSFATDSLDFNQDNLWLDITFNGENFGSRVRLAAVPYAFSAEKVAGLTVTNNGGNTLNIAANKTVTVSNTLTFAGTDATTMTFPSSSTTVAGLAIAQTFSNAQTITPTQNSVSALTLNGTSGTATTTLTVGQGFAADGEDINLTNTSGTQTSGLLINRNGASGTTTNGLKIMNSAGVLTTGILVDDAVSGATITDGLKITNSAGTAITNGITIGSGSQAITTGINIASTGVTTDLSLQNGETIDNDTNGQIKINNVAPTASQLVAALLIGPNALASPSNANGTFFGLNAGTTFAGDLENFQQNSVNLFRILSVGSAVNGFKFSTKATGTAPVIASSSDTGSDANLGLTINAIGTGTLTLDSVGAGTVNVGAGNATTIGIGNGSSALTINSTHFAVTSAGAISGVTTLGLSGAITGQTATNTINGMIINGSTATFTANTLADSGALTINSGSGSNNITLQAGGSGTTARVLIGAGNGGAGSTTPDLLGLDISSSGSDPTGFNGAMYYNTNLAKFRCFEAGSWANCLTLGSASTALNNISAAGANQTGIANGANTIVWNWGSLTSGTAMTYTGGAAMTTGADFTIGDAAFGTKYVHTAAETGALQNIYFDDESTNTSGLSITAGLNLVGKINTSGAGTKEIDGLRFAASTLTGCASGACTVNGLMVNTATSGFASTITQNGLNIAATGVSAGTLTGVNISAITGGAGTETGLSIGSGWDNAISAAGNVLIESQTNTADANTRNWTVKNATAGTLNTTPFIASISASVVYNGSLYIGTYNNGKAEVYRYNGATAGTFTALNSTAGTFNTTAAIDGVTSMSVYNGYMYVGTSKVGAGPAGQAEIYRYDGGSTFTTVNSAAGTIGGVTNQASVSAMTVWDGDLYAGTCKSGAAEVFKYQGGTTWLPVSGAGTIATTAGVDCISSLISYNNYLIAGDKKIGSAEVYRYTGGTGWIRLNPTAGTFTLTSSGGTAASAVDGVRSMVVYNGHLVVGLQKASGADIVEYDDVTGALAPVNDWSRLNSVSGTIGSTAAVNAVASMAVYNGRLYVGTDSTAGGEIWRYDNGEISTTGWTKVSQNTKGTIGSTGTPTTNIDSVTQLIQYGNDLWAGTAKTGAAELYNYTFIAGQSYALKFNAPTTQALQNGLENLGSISFIASPSASMGNGGFVFSNGIVTNAGAYDVAEDYPTRDQLFQPGDLVAIDTHEKGMVQRSQTANSNTVIGIYSANPGFDLSQQGTTIDGVPTIPVALVGRVPVNVSTESGQIKSGDYITSSSLPGIGMKATTAGPVIGQALQDYDPSLAGANGVEQIVMFVSHAYFNGISQDALAGLSGSGNLSAVQFIGDPTQNHNGQLAVLAASDSATLIASQDGILTNLTVNGLATISGNLRVKGDSLFEGILHVADTLMANNFITNGISDFFGSVIFHGDVTFQKTPTFSQDTAGLAVIHKDADHVDVVFTTAYPMTPIINATMVSVTSQDDLQTTVFANGYSYIITHTTDKGFTIQLNKKAVSDVQFGWSALVVPSPTIFESNTNSSQSVLQNEEGQAVSISPAPTGSPAQ